MFHFSLKTKMVITVSILVTLLMIGLSWLIIAHFERRFRESIATQQFALISEMARDVDETVQRTQKALIARAALLTERTVNNPGLAQRELDQESDLYTLFDNGLFLFSPAGNLIAEYPDLKRQGTNFAYRDYIRTTLATAKSCISAPYLSTRANHKPAIMFTAPVFGKDGSIVAILGGGINLMRDNLLGHNESLTIGKSGYIYLCNSDRTIIMHPDKSRILKQDEPPGANGVFTEAIAGPDGTQESVESHGLRALTSIKHLKSVNWIMGANYPLAEAFAPIRQAVRYSIIAVIAGILISTLIVWQGMKILTAPLQQLNRHIRAISDLDGVGQEIRIDSTDEIGELAASYNKMMRMIGEKQEELSEKVVELEAALASVKQLEGIIPICMHCKNIRNDKEIWQRLEHYLTEHSEALFSHGVCPDCLEKHYGEKLVEQKDFNLPTVSI